MLTYEEQRSLFFGLLLSFDILWLVVNTIIYFKYRGLETIRKRNPMLVLLNALGHFVFFHGVLFSLDFLQGYLAGFSNTYLVSFCLGIGGTLFLFSYIAMALSLVVVQILAKIKVQLESGVSNGRPFIDSTQRFLIHLFLMLKHDPFAKHEHTASGRSSAAPNGSGQQGSGFKNGSVLGSVVNSVMGTEAYLNMEHSQDPLAMINGHISNRVLLLHLGAMVTFLTIAGLINSIIFYPMPGSSQYTSLFGKIIIVTFAWISILLLLQMLYAMRSFKDSLGIKYELTTFLLVLAPVLLIYLFLEWHPYFAQSSFRQEIGSDVALLVETYLMFFVTNLYLLIYSFIESRRRNKFVKQVEMADQGQKTGMDDLIDAVLNPVRFNRLKKHLVEDLCPENALFVEDMIQGLVKLRKPLVLKDRQPIFIGKQQNLIEGSDLPSSDIKDMKEINEQVFLKYLYKRYIKADAPNELNIPSKLRKGITKPLIEEKKPNLTIALYEGVMEEVLKMIYTNTYPRFKTSEEKRISGSQ
ncbi:hypothetical protein EDD86DRAFT_198386 [Gorgonomyces haynaldii]|nr:hypothetical protein EDD86DRAFT_198386 [Gorgonomyces haynaldii]